MSAFDPERTLRQAISEEWPWGLGEVSSSSDANYQSRPVLGGPSLVGSRPVPLSLSEVAQNRMKQVKPSMSSRVVALIWWGHASDHIKHVDYMPPHHGFRRAKSQPHTGGLGSPKPSDLNVAEC
jgi:hypothetical protein